jgi:hypothetical protein
MMTRSLAIYSQLVELVFYGGTVLVAFLALSHPELFPVFWNQNFEFIIVAEFVAIHGSAVAGSFSRPKAPLPLKPVFLVFELLLLAGAMVAYHAWTAGIFLAVSLGVKFFRHQAANGRPNKFLAIQTGVFLFSIFTIGVAGGLITFLFPAYDATSDPLYMSIMHNVGYAAWLIEYYGLLSIVGVLAFLRFR